MQEEPEAKLSKCHPVTHVCIAPRHNTETCPPPSPTASLDPGDEWQRGWLLGGDLTGMSWWKSVICLRILARRALIVIGFQPSAARTQEGDLSWDFLCLAAPRSSPFWSKKLAWPYAEFSRNGSSWLTGWRLGDMGRIGFAVKNGVLVIWGCLLHARDYTTPPAFLKNKPMGKNSLKPDS